MRDVTRCDPVGLRGAIDALCADPRGNALAVAWGSTGTVLRRGLLGSLTFSGSYDV